MAKKQKNKSWHLSSVLLHKSSPYMYYNCRFWYNLVWSTYLVFLSSQKYDFPIEKVQNLDFDRLCRPTRACPEGEIWLLWSPLYKRSYYKKRFVKSLNFFLTHPTYQMDFALFSKFYFLLNGARKPPKMGWGVLSQLVVLILLIPHSTIFGQYFHFPLSLSTFTFQRKWKWNRRSEWSLYGCPENQCKGCDWIAIQDGLYLPPSSESQKIQNLEKCPSEKGSEWVNMVG